jgi:hypothetical protein
MGSDEILSRVYEIQGRADASHPAETLAERMQEIYDLACEIMQGTGYQPD